MLRSLFFVIFTALAWVNPAFAEAPAQESILSGAMGQFIMLGGFFAIFYFFIIRPQNKRAKEHRDLLSNLSKGDEVTTNGGILGKINRVGDDFLHLMVAEGIEIRVQKQAIANVLPKGTFKSV